MYKNNTVCKIAFGLLLAAVFSACSPIHERVNLSSSNDGQGTLVVDEQLQAQALAVIENRCNICHGANGLGGVSNITDVDHLIATGLIVPGDPSKGRLINSIVEGTMPQGSPMQQPELDDIISWVSSMSYQQAEGDSSDAGADSGI